MCKCLIAHEHADWDTLCVSRCTLLLWLVTLTSRFEADLTCMFSGVFNVNYHCACAENREFNSKYHQKQYRTCKSGSRPRLYCVRAFCAWLRIQAHAHIMQISRTFNLRKYNKVYNLVDIICTALFVGYQVIVWMLCVQNSEHWTMNISLCARLIM